MPGPGSDYGPEFEYGILKMLTYLYNIVVGNTKTSSVER